MCRKILITRPYESAVKFSGQIADAFRDEDISWDCIIAPLLIAKYDGEDDRLPTYNPAFSRELLPDLFPGLFPASLDQNIAMIISSSQIFKTKFFTQNRDQLRALPLFCVGPETASLAFAHGLTPIQGGHATMKDALHCLRAALPPGTHILYLRGADVRHDLAVLLPKYHLHEITLYAMMAHPHLEKSVLDIFPTLNVITVFSKRSALILQEVLEKYHLTKALNSMTLLAISNDSAAPLTHYAWRQICVAPSPDAKGMIASLRANTPPRTNPLPA